VKLTILGSAAAEAWPALFCECEYCAEARRRGGKNIRRRSCYRVNDNMLVDFGPDINWQSTEFGIDLADIQHIVMTHSHQDHLVPIELLWRWIGYCHVSRTVRLYGNQNVFGRVEQEVQHEIGDRPLWETLHLEPVAMSPGVTVPAGDLKVTAIEANHGGPHEVALNYVIEHGDQALLIANDTGWWGEESWDLVSRFRLDIAVIECTFLMKGPDVRDGHLGANVTVAFRDKLAELGALKPGAQVVTNHFSHNGRTLHEELCEFFAPHGIAVGYDGLVVEG